jgi:hypothetical protein
MIYLTICTVGIAIDCQPVVIAEIINKFYQSYLEMSEMNYSVQIQWEKPSLIIDPKESVIGKADAYFKQGCYYVSSGTYAGFINPNTLEANLVFKSWNPINDIDYFLRIIVAYGLFRLGGLLLHSAGIVRSDQAYIFFGHSGSGKSTVANYSANDIILSDDLVGLLPTEKGIFALSTPFWNFGGEISKKCNAQVFGLFHLIQNTRVFIEPLRTSMAISEILSNIPVLAMDESICDQLVDNIRNIIHKVQVYSLNFKRDDSFWGIVEQLGN